MPIIESILSDAIKWMDENDLHQWETENFKWSNLSKYYAINDFYIAYDENILVVCMVLIDCDPDFWPDVPMGESFYLHKAAVVRKYAGKSFSKESIDFAKVLSQK